MRTEKNIRRGDKNEQDNRNLGQNDDENIFQYAKMKKKKVYGKDRKMKRRVSEKSSDIESGYRKKKKQRRSKSKSNNQK